MARAKKNAFAALGWVAWQALAKVGVPAAKRKLKSGDNRRPSGY
ncbi:hypothetical protein [Terracoccus luteus]|jgi:hypothetical protein|uniref:Uncharacterized protein n=1 Tax=Terracoccus luteus TaxID=53356 RepID=A0A495XYX2_9MICO|nr:hypothetical protein [Terracoccus luteus]MBB2988374.1 hypothetical protein [Terracoccus luteus]MCP2173996.1 hypothetical protein [Terracoccus luteus]RKT79497.1 hypothetical protein DFJ68_2970 [Terracoccus luteus]